MNLLTVLNGAITVLQEQNAKLHEERNVYRNQLRQVNRAQRLAKLELKELKLKYDYLLESQAKQIVDAEDRIISLYQDQFAVLADVE